MKGTKSKSINRLAAASLLTPCQHPIEATAGGRLGFNGQHNRFTVNVIRAGAGRPSLTNLRIAPGCVKPLRNVHKLTRSLGPGGSCSLLFKCCHPPLPASFTSGVFRQPSSQSLCRGLLVWPLANLEKAT